MDIPHKDRTFDKHRNRTTLTELLYRHNNPLNDTIQGERTMHKSVWITEDLLALCKYFNWTIETWRDVDDKLGIGFTIVIKKQNV